MLNASESARWRSGWCPCLPGSSGGAVCSAHRRRRRPHHRSPRTGICKKEIGDGGRLPQRGSCGSVCWQSALWRRAPRARVRVVEMVNARRRHPDRPQSKFRIKKMIAHRCTCFGAVDRRQGRRDLLQPIQYHRPVAKHESPQVANVIGIKFNCSQQDAVWNNLQPGYAPPPPALCAARCCLSCRPSCAAARRQ